MPKVVDHDVRRTELAAAVRRVIARAGIEGASVRAVAEEAGWSTGALRYYFSNHDQLIDFAVAAMLKDLPDRLRDIQHNKPSSFQRGIDMLELLLPIDDDRLAEARVYLAFSARASIRSDHELLRQSWHGTRYICARAIADATGLKGPTRMGAVPAGLHIATEQLQVHVEGLTVLGSSLKDLMPPAKLRASLRSRLAEIVADLGGPAAEGWR